MRKQRAKNPVPDRTTNQDTGSRRVPRLVPDEPFPPYAYVPGRFPHPRRDPRGHSYGVEPKHPDPPDPNSWATCRPYLYGVDLFNHGYYWEAHEYWEELWHACGRSGSAGCFFQGLIRLAAAAQKLRMENSRGVRHHTRRAKELFQQTATLKAAGEVHYMGLSLNELIGFADDLCKQPAAGPRNPASPVETVCGFVLCPR